MRRLSPSLTLALVVLFGGFTRNAGAEEPPKAPPATTAAEPAAPGTPAPGEVVRSVPPPLAPPPLAPPVIDLRQPEPPPPEPLRMHRHDGFYFRGDVGLLVARTFVTSNALNHPSYSVGDGGLGADLSFGGSPSPGMALGGTLSLASIQGGSSTAGFGMLGVFVDGFPDVNGGFHLGGALGIVGSRTTRPGSADELHGGGLGMAAWLGQDFWVADEWSMGGLVRMTGAFDGDRSHDHGSDAYRLDSSTYGVAFLFSVLYH